jgi:hypothetical protein
VSTLLHAIDIFLQNLLNVLVHIANKMGLQEKNMNHKYEYMYCSFENMYVLLDLNFRE